MKRGDVVVAAATGDFGKPRLAVIIQTDAFPETHISVVVCQMTSEITEALDFRVTIDPRERNGLRIRSQIMADKPVTVRRARVAQPIGRLDDGDIARLNVALAFVGPRGLTPLWRDDGDSAAVWSTADQISFSERSLILDYSI
jgi:mRNA interferase MazF